MKPSATATCDRKIEMILSDLCRAAQGDQGKGLKAYLHEGPTSYSASVCFKKVEKFCSYKQSNLMQNRPLKSDV